MRTSAMRLQRVVTGRRRAGNCVRARCWLSLPHGRIAILDPLAGRHESLRRDENKGSPVDKAADLCP
jgi:hypothetical protein